MLITGETGTGKEMVARAIHRASDRADRPFLPFNCAAVPRDLLESQLFGHRKGAFTGADAGFPGVIRSAAGGTLFLDEIGEIGPEMQPKLLRFLETHEIHPLGEPHPLKVDVRVIAATNASVEQLMADGRFRDDLFYRLNVMRLSLPPLRERREEIPPLVQHYVRKYADEQRKGQLTLADDTLEYLLLFSWPGNVRQLANEIQRMVALAEPDSTLTPALLSPEIQASRRTIPAPPAAEPRSAGRPRSAAAGRRGHARTGDGAPRARSHARPGRRGVAAARHLPQGPVPQTPPLGPRARSSLRGRTSATRDAAEERRQRHVAHGVQARAPPRGSSAAS